MDRTDAQEIDEISEAPNLARDVEEAIADTELLVEYLGRKPDSRLQAQFDDSPDKVSSRLAAKPPCESYLEFLNKLSTLWIEYASDKKIPDGEFQCNGKPISKIAFLFWSRDFLACLAGPATAETIKFTRYYLLYRFPSKAYLSLPAKTARNPAKLARSVHWMFAWAYFITIVTVFLSVYALSGQKILAARDVVRTTLKDIDDKIATIEANGHFKTVNHHMLDYLVRAKRRETEDPELSRIADTSTPATKDISSASFFLCDNVESTEALNEVGHDIVDKSSYTGAQTREKVPSYGPISNGAYYYFGSVEQIAICRDRARTLTQLFAIGEEVISWQRLLTNPVDVLFPSWVQAAGSQSEPVRFRPVHNTEDDFANLVEASKPFLTFLEEIASAPADVFGVAKSVPRELAKNPTVCEGFAPGPNCARRLGELSEYYGTIPENILGCLTLYVLPCLYGYLGAVTGIFKMLKVQVEDNTLSFTTRGRVIQTQILGIMFGSIVGLFSAYVTGASHSLATLSVSAIAFLAGYNIASVLAFLDGLSDRVFRAAAGSPAPAAR